MNAAGVPLGLILNFGRPEFEYKRVVHRNYLQQWRRERLPAALVSLSFCASGWTWSGLNIF
ncbi:hypothetical protein AGMMS50268_39270 [Spirochaetia bacterium]|nr:hypothetical protein AGMMS50268_39270 [Spirochaetia bacterium]